LDRVWGWELGTELVTHHPLPLGPLSHMGQEDMGQEDMGQEDMGPEDMGPAEERHLNRPASS
jgi:hypothetical protein